LLVNAELPGQRLFTDFNLTVSTYDIEFIKHIPVGQFDNCCCPRWDLSWSAGARIADIRRKHTVQQIAPEGGVSEDGQITDDFTGAGPRIGLEGRRYCGPCSPWSVFAKGDLSLLLGTIDITRRLHTTDPETVELQFDKNIRVVPVAEMEVGASYQLAPHTQISVGWLFQAWMDVGAFETASATDCACGTDDANIMSFDGFFGRLEICF
jgi:hypothetical protein